PLVPAPVAAGFWLPSARRCGSLALSATPRHGCSRPSTLHRGQVPPWPEALATVRRGPLPRERTARGKTNMEFTDFSKFLAAVRAGDQQAAADLVRRYEPYLRRVIGLRLKSTQLRRVLDSMDICQSILAKFFDRAAAGELDVQTPEELQHLLVAMAINKLRDKVRHERRHQGGLPDDWEPVV